MSEVNRRLFDEAVSAAGSALLLLETVLAEAKRNNGKVSEITLAAVEAFLCGPGDALLPESPPPSVPPDITYGPVDHPVKCLCIACRSRREFEAHHG